jgi:hypothetical protein
MLVLVALLAGCVTEKNSLHYLGSDLCGREEECAKGQFDSNYDSHAECVDDYEDANDDWQQCLIDAGCEFDPKELAECRDTIRTSSCEDFTQADWIDDCTHIYDCDDADAMQVATCTWNSYF